MSVGPRLCLCYVYPQKLLESCLHSAMSVLLVLVCAVYCGAVCALFGNTSSFGQPNQTLCLVIELGVEVGHRQPNSRVGETSTSVCRRLVGGVCNAHPSFQVPHPRQFMHMQRRRCSTQVVTSSAWCTDTLNP